jgi:hypothetical protein
MEFSIEFENCSLVKFCPALQHFVPHAIDKSAGIRGITWLSNEDYPSAIIH